MPREETRHVQARKRHTRTTPRTSARNNIVIAGIGNTAVGKTHAETAYQMTVQDSQQL